ncbi:hypothetical protein [Marinobacter sp. bablab_jr008]|uniref:hypothetical protein n=1 Tax=Marinobacter sp. bablab_jr008 TaxID=2755064 RepID=UPI0018F1C2FC|nr:hypothetical protein [Marinobacter sp. bablab_jr008]
MKKLTAAQRADRLREIAAEREELMPEFSDIRSRLANAQGGQANLEKQLQELTSPPPKHGWRNAGRSDDIAQVRRKLDQATQNTTQLQEEIRPFQKQLDDLDKEEERLINNPPAVSLADLQQTQAEITKLETQIDRIEQAREEAAARTPTEGIESLKDEIAQAASDRDLLAADLDLGEGSEADLKKATTHLTKLRKQLAEQEETASLAGATQRGYEKRLADLSETKRRAEQEFRCQLSLYAKEIHDAGLQRILKAFDEVGAALHEILVANKLSGTHGDGDEFSRLSGRIKLDMGSYYGIDNSTISADEELVSERVARILADIRKS